MILNQDSLLQDGKYLIVKSLGQGGFGITYLALHVELERFVAIKEFFPKDFCERDENSSTVSVVTKSNYDFVGRLKERFLTEAKNISKLSHPGIVQIHDIFQENGTAYYVMDYVDGKSLSEIVSGLGHGIDEQRAVRYINALGNALAYIHSHKMTHYDIKPANIMVRDADDMPVLIDFGLSKQYSEGGTANSTMLNAISHGYSPMEQYIPAEMEKFSPSTDVYALAATLLYLLTGQTPPHASIVNEEGIVFPANMSAAVKRAISGAMQSRKNRYQSVEAFLQVLNNRGGITPPPPLKATPIELEEEKTELHPSNSDSGSGKSLPPSNPTINADSGSSGDGALKVIGWILVIAVAIALIAVMAQGGCGNQGTYYEASETGSAVTEDTEMVELIDEPATDSAEVAAAPAPEPSESVLEDAVAPTDGEPDEAIYLYDENGNVTDMIYPEYEENYK